MHEDLTSEYHWTLDPSIQRYLLSAACLAGVCLLLGILGNIISFDEAAISLPLRIAVGVLLGVSGAISALFLWLSMLWYWWHVDRKERGMNVFWLLALSLGNWVGAIVYYFFVFRRVVDSRIGKNAF